MTNQNKSYIFTFFAILFWSTVASAFKISLQYLSTVQLLLFSTLTSFSILLIIAISTKRIYLVKTFNSKDFLFSSILGFINPFFYYLILFKAYELLPAQIAQPLNCTWGIILVLLSVPILHHKIGWQNIAAIFLSFCGIVIITIGGKSFGNLDIDNYGVVLALITSIIWSFYWIYNTKDQKDELIRLLVNFFFGSIYILLFTLIKGEFSGIHFNGIFGAIYVGIFEMGLTFWFWLKAMKLSENTAKISIYIYFFPFLSMIFIQFILKESIQLSSFIGLILIMTGVVWNKLS